MTLAGAARLNSLPYEGEFEGRSVEEGYTAAGAGAGHMVAGIVVE